MRLAKSQASLRIRAVSPEPSLFAHFNNELKRPAKQVATCAAGGEAEARIIGIVSLSHTMQKNSHAAADWFPKCTAEYIGLMLNPKTNANLCLFPAEKYDDQIAPLQTWKASQPPQAISLAVMNRIANEIEGYIFYDIGHG